MAVFYSVLVSMFLIYVNMNGQAFTSPAATKCNALNSFVSCYHIINITVELENLPNIRLTFSAFGKIFALILEQSNSDRISNNRHYQMGSNINVTVVNHERSKSFNYDIHDYVFGYVKNMPYSRVHGRYSNNVFTGIVRTTQETYYVEKESKYFKNRLNELIIYRASDVQVHTGRLRTKIVNRNSFLIRNRQIPISSHRKDKSDFTRTFQKRKRSKRAVPSNTICEVKAVADHTFFEHIGQSNIEATLAEIFYNIAEADNIFRITDFNGDSFYDNVGFHLASVDIYEMQSSQNYYMSVVNDNVDYVLDSFSLYDHDDVCLAILFTHRDYYEGVIGLAWMGSSSNYGYPGGLCQSRIQYDNTHHSFNTLLISTLNFGSIIPRHVTALTLAHELGHSFGAPHDNVADTTCAPGGLYGHYLMYPYSSNADKPNERKFSPCSIMHMSPVIANKGIYCLKSVAGSTCGNAKVEAGEECDCGYKSKCDTVDSCCHPADANNNTGCSIRREVGAVCSPKSSRCCTSMCMPTQNNDTLCREATECAKEAFCSGNSSVCPTSEKIPDGTPCDGGKKICDDGECSKSVCELKQLQECQCVTEKSFMCQICCRCGNSNNLQSPCVPASKLGITHANGSVIYLASGQTCNNYNGYCNQRHICVRSDIDGVLDRLNNFFSDDLVGFLKKLGQNYWFFIILTFVLLIVILGAIKVRRKKCDPVRVKSEQHQQLVSLVDHAEKELSALQDQLIAINHKYTAKVDNLECYKEMEAAIAIGRLSTFFPTASREEITLHLKDSANEEQVVRLLLFNGFPMRKLFEEHEREEYYQNTKREESTEVEI